MFLKRDVKKWRFYENFHKSDALYENAIRKWNANKTTTIEKGKVKEMLLDHREFAQEGMKYILGLLYIQTSTHTHKNCKHTDLFFHGQVELGVNKWIRMGNNDWW